MKTYLEIADDVFRKGDACLEEKKKRREQFKSRAAAALVSAVILFSALGITKGLLPRKAPAMLPVPSAVSATTAAAPGVSAVSGSKTDPAPASEQPPAQSARTTTRQGSASEPSRTAQSGAAVSEKAPVSDTPASETTTEFANDGSGENPVSQADPALTPTDEAAGTTEPNAERPTEADDPDETPSSDAEPSNASGREDQTRKLSPAGSRPYFSAARLRNAMIGNACGWIRYEGRYYVQTDQPNANELEIGEKLGEAGDFAGNLDLLGLSGSVYRPEDEAYAYCLLLKTDDGRELLFVADSAD